MVLIISSNYNHAIVPKKKILEHKRKREAINRLGIYAFQFRFILCFSFLQSLFNPCTNFILTIFFLNVHINILFIHLFTIGANTIIMEITQRETE